MIRLIIKKSDNDLENHFPMVFFKLILGISKLWVLIEKALHKIHSRQTSIIIYHFKSHGYLQHLQSSSPTQHFLMKTSKNNIYSEFSNKIFYIFYKFNKIPSYFSINIRRRCNNNKTALPATILAM